MMNKKSLGFTLPDLKTNYKDTKNNKVCNWHKIKINKQIKGAEERAQK